MWASVVSEFLGTFALVFFACGTAALIGGKEVASLDTSLAFGLVLTLITVVFHGGHCNPAVSLGFALVGQLNWVRLFLYWIAQFTGGIVAAAFLLYLVGSPTGLGASVGSFTNTDALKAVIVEAAATWMFVSAVLWTVDGGATIPTAPIIIGFGLWLGVLFAYPMTGGSLNPARSLGPAIFSGNVSTVWIYFVGPFIGAMLAAAMWWMFLKPHQEAKQSTFNNFK